MQVEQEAQRFPLQEQPHFVLPTLWKQKRCACWFGFASTLIALAGVAVSLHATTLTEEVLGILLPCFGGILAVVLFPVLYLVAYCEDSNRAHWQEEMDRNPEQRFRMSLAAASVVGHLDMMKGPDGLRRKQVWNMFPWIDLAMATPILICAAVIAEARTLLVCLGVGLGGMMVLIRYLVLLCLMCSYKRGVKRARSKEIVFLSTASCVLVVFDGELIRFALASRINGILRPLVKSQLVAQRQDVSNETSPIIGWSLRLVYASMKNDNWEAAQHLFPVDPGQVHAFQQWLSSGPQCERFRFCGIATQPAMQIPVGLSAIFRPVQAAQDDGLEGLGQGHRFVVSANFSLVVDGQVDVNLTSMGGNQIAVLSLHDSDTVADLYREVSLRPEAAGNRVTIICLNGQCLDNVSAMTMLSEVLAWNGQDEKVGHDLA